MNVDHKISPKLSVSASNLYVKSSTQDPGGDDKSNGGVFFNVLLFEPDVDFKYANPDGQPYNFIANTWQSGAGESDLPPLENRGQYNTEQSNWYIFEQSTI